MSTKTQLLCAWAAPAGVVLLMIGFWPIAGYVPPPPAHDSAQQIAHFYREHPVRIRSGLLLTFVACSVWGPLVAVITRQMLRIRYRDNVLAYVQLVAGGVAWVFLLVPLLILSAAAFRPDRAPDTTQALHDLGWFLLIMPIVPFCVQNVSIGIAVLQDDVANPVFPRWLGYFNLWIAFLFVPGGLITFFKTGPFAYNGVLAFWVPLTAFCIWLFVMPYAVRRAILQEAETG